MASKRNRKRSPARRGAGRRTTLLGRVSAARRRLSELDQRQLDLIGLALVGLGVYFAFVFYFDWDGGEVGSALAEALRFLGGAVAYITPVALFVAGASLVMKPFLPSLRPVRAGGTAVIFALLLGFAAQTAGLGPSGAERDGLFEPDFFRDHGGAAGELLYWSMSTLFQRIGAHVLAIVLFSAGLLLLTGMSIAAFLNAGGRAIRRVGESTTEFARLVQHRFERESTQLDRTEPGFSEPAFDEPLADGDGAETEIVAPEDVPAHSYDDGLEPGDAPSDADDIAPPEPDGEAIEVARTPMGERRGVTQSEEVTYQAPSPKLLERGGPAEKPDTRGQDAVGRTLLETLGHFGVEAKMIGTVSGPHVSRYEIQLAPGTKVAKVAQLKDDLAYALASTEIRILAPIPGKQAVGVEVPNLRRRIVRMGDIYKGRPQGSSPLAAWLGKDISGNAVWTDLAKMPHLLVAGTTGSGKSGCVNAVLSSILLHASPNEVRLVLVDPKQVELNHYEAVPHLLTPVVTAPRLAANVLSNLIREMENRYAVMGEARARNLVELNRTRKKAGEAPLPYVLCVIDELADLMMVAPAEVEDSIIRLAQKSRAVGIHLLLATQRPSTDIITGTIKVNIPARIAFAVSSQVDSRVILDQGGAEALLGAGDMLFRPVGTSRMQRIQGAFITEEEISRITSHWSRQGEPDFEQQLLEVHHEEPEDAEEGEFDPDQDDMLEQAISLVVQSQSASVSMLQRRMRVGYTRAGRLIDMLERRGIISGYEGSKPRQVLVTEADLTRVLSAEHAAPAEAEAASMEN